MSEKRYEALYVNPGFCDGFNDNETSKYLTDQEIEDLLNKADKYEKDFKSEYREIIDENYKFDVTIELLSDFIRSDKDIFKKFCIWLIER